MSPKTRSVRSRIAAFFGLAILAIPLTFICSFVSRNNKLPSVITCWAAIFLLLLLIYFYSRSKSKNEDNSDVKPVEPTVITFVAAESDSSTASFDVKKLAQPSRLRLYTYDTINQGSLAIPRHITDYYYLGDMENGDFVATYHKSLILEFYWYGYQETRSQETITLTCTPGSRKGKVPLLTVTSHCGDQEAVIYESAVVNIIRQPQLSPGYTVETFSLEEFADVVAAGKAPRDMLFRTPRDAGYVVKACIELQMHPS